MFRTASLFAALVCAPVCAAPVPAQPKADGALPASAVRLLEHRRVQKELKMTAEQRIALVDALADVDEVYDKKFFDLLNLPNFAEEALDKLQQDQQREYDKAYAAAASGLTAAQRVRLRQLDARVRGVAALADPAVEKALQLTDAQKKKVKDALAQLAPAVEKFLADDGEDDTTEEQRRALLFAVRAERLKDVEAALTNEQKAEWARLLGEKPTGVDANELWLRSAEDAMIERARN